MRMAPAWTVTIASRCLGSRASPSSFVVVCCMACLVLLDLGYVKLYELMLKVQCMYAGKLDVCESCCVNVE